MDSNTQNYSVPQDTTNMTESRQYFRLVYDTLWQVLFAKADHRYFNIASDIMRSTIDYTLASVEAPNWISLSRYGEELHKLSHPNIWGALINDGHPLLSRFKLDDVDEIHKQNSKFYSLAIQLIGYAALFGQQFHRYVTDEGKVTATSFGAAYLIAQNFQQPAESADDLVQRMQHLFPQNRETDVDNSAFLYLQRAGSFQQVEIVNWKGVHLNRTGCPAINLTQTIFEVYGDILSTDEYQEFFKNAIARDSDSYDDMMIEMAKLEIKARPPKRPQEDLFTITHRLLEETGQIVHSVTPDNDADQS